MLISMIILWIVVIAYVGGWIWAMLKQLRNKEYVWFVFTMIINVTWLIYAIVKAIEK